MSKETANIIANVCFWLASIYTAYAKGRADQEDYEEKKRSKSGRQSDDTHRFISGAGRP